MTNVVVTPPSFQIIHLFVTFSSNRDGLITPHSDLDLMDFMKKKKIIVDKQEEEVMGQQIITSERVSNADTYHKDKAKYNFPLFCRLLSHSAVLNWVWSVLT